MKEEEFNDFLRDRADSFELKPTSGSFEAVERKMKKTNKRKKVFFMLPVLLLGIITTIYFGTNTQINTNASALKVDEKENDIKSKAEQGVLGAANTNTTDSKANKNAQVNASDKTGLDIKTEDLSDDLLTSKNSVEERYTIINETSFEKAENEASNKGGGNLLSTKAEPALIISDNKKLESSSLPLKNVTIGNNTDLALAEISRVEVEESNNTIKPPKKKKLADSSGCNCNDKKWAVRLGINPFLVTKFRSSEEFYNENNNEAFFPTSSVKESFSKEYFNQGVNLHFGAERKITKRLSLGMGIGYSYWDLDIAQWSEQRDLDSNVSYNFDITTNSVTRAVSYESRSSTLDSSFTSVAFHSIQIPVFANLDLANYKRFTVSMLFGATANYLFHTRQTTYSSSITPSRLPPGNSSPTKNYNENYRTFNINLNTGVTGHYSLGKCWGLYGGVNLATSLLSINSAKSQAIKRPLFIGVETGIRLKF